MKPDPLQMNANGTHSCVLAGIITQTTGPVLELGIGHYSTPLIHFMCRNRPVLSVESDREWMQFYANSFKNGCHDFQCFDRVSSIFEMEQYKDLQWDVAFVDHSPSEDRRVCVESLRTRAKYIVVHDSEPLAVVYKWDGIFETFKYKYYWDFFGNGTTVVSDICQIELE